MAYKTVRLLKTCAVWSAPRPHGAELTKLGGLIHARIQQGETIQIYEGPSLGENSLHPWISPDHQEKDVQVVGPASLINPATMQYLDYGKMAYIDGNNVVEVSHVLDKSIIQLEVDWVNRTVKII